MACRTLVGDADGTETGPGEEPLHEAVALRQLLEGLDHLAIDESEVTGVLRQLGAGGEGVEEAVEAAGGEALHRGVGAAIDPDAVDGVVVTCLPQLDELQDEGGGILQIHVHGNHGIALGLMQACGHGRFLAEVAGQVDQGHAGIAGNGLFDHFTGAVAAAVIDEHDFKPVFEGSQFGIYRADEGVYALFLVVNGHDQRESKIGMRHGNFLIERIIL